MKKNFLLKLFLATMLFVPTSANAQQENSWFLQLTSSQREATIYGEENLIIYNVDNNCVESWNGKWISLCECYNETTLSPEPCYDINFEGTGCEDMLFNPDCIDGPFGFTIVAGEDFAYLSMVNETDGWFQITFYPNDLAYPRLAVVRVTNYCNDCVYKDFLFTQDGQFCGDMFVNAQNAHSVSLCEENSIMTIYPHCQEVEPDGTGCDYEFKMTDPNCIEGPFGFAIVTGEDFVQLSMVNEAEGKFRIAFQPNESRSSRSAVVRVTNSCTGMFKEFPFKQHGNSCCRPGSGGVRPFHHNFHQ